jgi:hypothetical protein
MRWRLYPQTDSNEVAGQRKRLNPRGFLLANPGKQSPDPNSKGIECGKCHTIIYWPEGEFDTAAFKTALKGHYVISPECAG